MSNVEAQKMEGQFHTKYSKIIDKKIIEELDKLPLYIAPNETDETYDKEHIQNDFASLKASEKSEGQLRPIEVAIWFNDPEKDVDNSHDRIHLRIINGRHRWRANNDWRREYFDFSQYAKTGGDAVTQYWLARGHFDLQKKQPKEERAVFVNDLAHHFMKQGIRSNLICTKIVDLLDAQGISSPVRIREVCDRKFKDEEMSERKEGKTFKLSGKDTKLEKKIKKVAGEKYEKEVARALKFETENTQLMKEQAGFQKTISEQENAMTTMQSDIRIMSIMETTETIDGVNVHAKIENKKIVLTKA